ncbi:cell division protein FtsB [Pseudothauera rhizosphaerae]|uniref:Cell division protein FtsB n=1 Tax=Pseudothauera rhizosphaerae TaxID=2565932 RepID=A0A4S4AU24_9RHOO|nr:cell division protein FtsB [Pseudothauera rhizosphaerae]THF63437.1 cell division protein FtsB [Pseudothauera rhizosphaerae]
MRWPLIILALLAVVLQYPLWLGKGGWLRVWEVDSQLQAQRAANHQLEQRNAALAAEVDDLKSGNEAVEERARYELGLTRPGEIYVHVPQKPGTKQGADEKASSGAAVE